MSPANETEPTAVETAAAPEATFHPVDQDRWPDLVRLFEGHGNPGYCWCMRWRAPSATFNNLKREGRKEALHDLVRAGVPIGVLGYVNGEPVGWCSIAPRETYAALERSRVLQRIDDEPVWSVVCFFLHRKVRGQGFAVRLLRAAVDLARAQGATVVEGYPVEPTSTSYTWMGSPAMFAAAGFRDVGASSAGRRVVRYEVDRAAQDGENVPAG